MKEITTELKLNVTLIEKYDDVQAEALHKNTKDKEALRKLADGIKEILVADKVDIVDVKIFERDMADTEVTE